jgi:hypothetical protein
LLKYLGIYIYTKKMDSILLAKKQANQRYLGKLKEHDIDVTHPTLKVKEKNDGVMPSITKINEYSMRVKQEAYNRRGIVRGQLTPAEIRNVHKLTDTFQVGYNISDGGSGRWRQGENRMKLIKKHYL